MHKKKQWKDCKNILVIRADNMGDLIMSTPALRALKESFTCKITVLTSSMSKAIVQHIPYIDDAIIYDTPWMKNTVAENVAEQTNDLLIELKKRKFDAAIIFTVYSQSALPAALIALLAGIPKRLAYCRENPYDLLTDWIPDKEPYNFIVHQVERDVKLVEFIGATTNNHLLTIQYHSESWKKAQEKLIQFDINFSKPFVLFHAGVSDEKRQYPVELWTETIRLFSQQTGYLILLTGTASEKILTDKIQENTAAFSIAGLLALDELIALIDHATALVSVNTGTVHIAAALQTPVAVLYAQTNPQHTPWMTPNAVLPFSIAEGLKSKNEVIRFVNEKLYRDFVSYPSPAEILSAFKRIILK